MVIKKKKKTDPASSTHEYFEDHVCKIPASELTEYIIKCSPVRRCISNMTALENSDNRARYMYKSFAALSAEKYHQFHYYPFCIHPFSKLRHWLETLTFISIVICNTIIAVYYTEFMPRGKDYYRIPITMGDGIYVLNIFLNFFTGYVEGHPSQHVVMNPGKIIFKYIKTWLFFDLMSTMGLVFHNEHENVVVYMTLISVKSLRVFTLVRYLKNVMVVNRISIASRTAIELAIYVITYLEWNMFFQYGVNYMVEESFLPEEPKRTCSWMSMGKLWNITSTKIRFLYSLDRAVVMLRTSVNVAQMEEDECHGYFYVIAWSVAKFIVLHCSLKYTIALFGSESAQAKYTMMAQQVNNWMDHAKIPARLKEKIIQFYDLRFQSNFFVENRMIACVPGQLREDIIIHTRRELVNHVDFLKQLPRPLLLQISFRLEVDIFIAGDIIFKINTLGNCIYFIDKGTVAIYSESGLEVCHLEDGDFFGETAIVLDRRFRTTSAVAVTNCELFRLDKDDFDSTIACYPTVYEDMKKVTIRRYENTKTMDEHHKEELKTLLEDANKKGLKSHMKLNTNLSKKQNFKR